MASIVPYKLKSGQRYMVRYLNEQNRSTDKKGFKTKRDAELWRSNYEVARSRGEAVDASAARITIGELGEHHIAHQTHLKPSSLRVVEVAWRKHVKPRWGHIAVGKVRHSDVQTWVTGLSQELGATSVIRAYGVLSQILDTAAKDRRITSNPAKGVNKPRKTTNKHVYLNHDQVSTLVSNCGERGTLVLLLAYTGLRWGEAIGLRVRDLDLLRRRLTVNENAVEVGGVIEIGSPKTHKRRTLILPALLVEPLSRECIGKAPDALVFSDSRGQHLRRTRVSTQSKSWFKTALKESGLEIMTFHDLRHTAASIAVSTGGTVKAVQRMLGHASAAMTLDVYADLFDDDLEALADRIDKAAQASKMGEKWAITR